MESSPVDQSLFYEHRPQRSLRNGELGQDDFMKILIAQLTNQDPLHPMEDREFITQMAQFSNLEQTIKMTQMFEQFIARQNDTLILQNTQLIGKQIKYVTYRDSDDGDEITEETITAIIQAVSFKGGEIRYELDNGETIRPEHIFEVREQRHSPFEELR